MMIDAPTRSPLRTSIWLADRVAGLAGEVASLIRWTIIVCPALHVDTCNQWVALETDGTDASCLVVLSQTLRTSTTWSLGVQARIDTVFVDAGLVQWAVIVHPALRPVALSVRISSVALGTGAHRVMHSCCALRLWCTWVLHDARVDAVLVDARLVHGTF